VIALQLLAAALTLLGNAFFVGGEFAMISARRSQIEPLAEDGDRRARQVLWGQEHLSALLATAQLGVTVCTLALGAVAEPAFAQLLEPLFAALHVSAALVHPIAFVMALATATYLHMLVGEMVPKNIALADPARAALALGPSLVALAHALRPVVVAVNALANGLLRLLRVEPRNEVTAAFSDAELARIVTDSGAAGLLDERSAERLHDALELGRRPVEDVAMPTGRVVTARLGVTPEGLERLAAESGFSRFPVIDDAGRVPGYLHVKDALLVRPRDQPFDASSLRPMPRLRAGTALDDALTAMRARRAHLAAVVDDADRPLALVAMEDLLRELVGQGPPAPING
jgi:CBS domain containing-hemolysin-like protein